ncbi:MAG: extracellular solute-binding protein [Candidatus Marinimicrobia bacterium]|nr:extracellular solute-binding protein [Candidatus Neomarinimicrobiota bacterium]
MSRYTTIFLIVIVAILISLLFYQIPIDFGKNKSSVNKIHFADNMTAAHVKLIRNFNQHYEGQIEVIPIHLPFEKFTTNERKELIARSLRNKNSKIDIFTVDCISVSRFAKWAEPLKPHLTEIEKNEILPEALQAEAQANQWVSIPLHVDIGVMFYRKDLVTFMDPSGELEKRIKNSITWEELVNLKKGRPLYLFQGYNYEGLICNCMELTGSKNPDIIGQYFENLDDLSIQQSCHFLYDLIYTYQIVPREVTGYDENAVYMHAISENIPFFRGWPGFLREIDDYPGGTALKEKIGIAPVPHFQGKNITSVFGGWNLMLSKNSKHKAAAILFLKFILSDEAQKILFQEAGYLPIKPNLYHDDNLLKEYPYLSEIRRMMKNGIYRPYIPNYTVKSDILSTAVNQSLKQEISVEKALKKASQKITLLEQTKFGIHK